MAQGKDVNGLESAISYRFSDPSVLSCAVTHSSFANEMKSKIPGIRSNERLEFLGDSVLGEIVSRFLYFKYPDESEGTLTKTRTALVCEETLADVARSISLGEYLNLGRGEETQGSRELNSILADALEALIAAIRIDGGLDAAESFVQTFLLSRDAKVTDYKSRLQQLVQQDGSEELSYRVVREEGPEHNKRFEVEALINSNPVGHGNGKSKRDAEQEAAREALLLFGFSL